MKTTLKFSIACCAVCRYLASRSVRNGFGGSWLDGSGLDGLVERRSGGVSVIVETLLSKRTGILSRRGQAIKRAGQDQTKTPAANRGRLCVRKMR